jgi:hypothetical protein
MYLDDVSLYMGFFHCLELLPLFRNNHFDDGLSFEFPHISQRLNPFFSLELQTWESFGLNIK